MAWLDQLRGLFQADQTPADMPKEKPHPHMLRVLLLLEAATADNDFDPAEHALIRRLIVEKYDVPADDFDDLLDLARKKRETQVDVYTFTRELSNQLSGDEREELMQEVWQVMYADDQLEAEEEYLARKFQKLLKLDHTRWVRAKMNAKNAS